MDRKKYIIEVSDDIQRMMAIGVAEDKTVFTCEVKVDALEELNSDYINEHFGELQDEAYQRGHDDGYEAGCATAFKPVSDAEYQRGFEDGKKSIDLGCDDCKYYEDTSLTNPCSECTRAWKDHYTPVPHSDRIEVGDIVDVYGNLGVVTYMYELNACVMMVEDGSSGNWNLNELKKTGKHYDIQSILEAMRE